MPRHEAAVPYRVVVPSRRRPQAMETILKLLPFADICVASSEVDSYIEAGVRDENILEHPDDLGGLTAKRQWIFDNVQEDCIVQIDDDFTHVRCHVGRGWRAITEPEAIQAIIENQINCASDLGVELFCWNRLAQQLWYEPHDPFGFSPSLTQAWGVIGRRHSMDQRLVGHTDADITLQYLRSSRIVLCDKRVMFWCNLVWNTKGGMQGVRTAENQANDRALLRKKWGPYVELEKMNDHNVPTYAIKVRRRSPVAVTKG